MKIAIDIDSTLHHYWDVLSDAARQRFGIELPYEEQYDWGITRLKEEQLKCVIDATHCEPAILAGRPYPGAVEAVNRWAESGHFVHITSHRSRDCQAATERWLSQIGLRYDELYCSYDKITRCEEIGIDLLIDDSPHNIIAALERGITVATITHPWNQDVVEEEEGVIAAADWPTLARELEAAVAPLRRTRRTGQAA
ncbi:MAG: hypothetical protein JWO90_1050 [Solirubrobacterales bacterium]|jgi:uncharacterized HAD superfamily protein|nr:hypothetical protein [Solirubrobacterales bacterium]